MAQISTVKIETSTKGKADSNRGTGVRARLVIPLGSFDYLFIYLGQREKLTYNADHPIFNDTREDNFSQDVFRMHFKLESYQIIVMHLQQKIESNLSFFDKELRISSVGIQWKL